MAAGAAQEAWDGKNWELRAALRAARRNRDDSARVGRRDPASDLVAAARELAEEGDGQFTVKQVAERAGTALQTFYRHFGSKDELLLALIEENIADGCADIAAAAAREPDPLDQLRTLVHSTILLTTHEEHRVRLRFHTRERPRLTELYPAAAEAAFAPYRNLVIEAMKRAKAAGRIQCADVERDADIIVHVVTSYAHAVGAHALPWSDDDVADHVWEFCLAALQRGASPSVVEAQP
jgi:AcrR family transcriptional regulator